MSYVCLFADKKPGWDQPYFSEFDICPPSHRGLCVSHSQDKLCSQYNADYNYYAVCRGLLSHYASESGLEGGLLHSIPDDLPQKKDIEGLLEQCVKPSSPDGRMEAKQSLLDILRTLARQHY